MRTQSQRVRKKSQITLMASPKYNARMTPRATYTNVVKANPTAKMDLRLSLFLTGWANTGME